MKSQEAVSLRAWRSDQVCVFLISLFRARNFWPIFSFISALVIRSQPPRSRSANWSGIQYDQELTRRNKEWTIRFFKPQTVIRLLWPFLSFEFDPANFVHILSIEIILSIESIIHFSSFHLSNVIRKHVNAFHIGIGGVHIRIGMQETRWTFCFLFGILFLLRSCPDVQINGNLLEKDQEGKGEQIVFVFC